MQDVVLRDGQAYFDLHGHHEHGPFDKFARQIDEVVLPMRARYLKAPQPVYFTETGAAMRTTGQDGDDAVNSEQEQAATLIKKIVFGWARGAEAFNGWCIVDSAEAEYGLFTKEFQRKTSDVSYNTLVTLLRGATFAQQTGAPSRASIFTGLYPQQNGQLGRSHRDFAKTEALT